MPNLPFSQYNLKDRARGFLSADTSSVATSFDLQAGDGAKFPASDFCVKIDNETIYVGTRTTDTCSGLTRGYNSTTAALHFANSLVFQAADAALFQRLYDNLSQHTHNKADIPDFAHTHPESDVTGLVSDLAGKEATNPQLTFTDGDTFVLSGAGTSILYPTDLAALAATVDMPETVESAELDDSMMIFTGFVTTETARTLGSSGLGLLELG